MMEQRKAINDFKALLNTHKVEKGRTDLTKTNTRMPSKTYNIYGGSWFFDDENYEKFLEHYTSCLDIDTNLIDERYFTEKQHDDLGRLAIDLDFRYDTSITSKQHSKEHIIDLIGEIEEFFNFTYKEINNNEIKCYVMEKENVNCLENKTKDGIHLIFNIGMKKLEKIALRDYLINGNIKNMWEDMPLTNSWEDVFDDGIMYNTTNWTLYGSKKPENETYKLRYVIELNSMKVTTIKTDEGDGVFGDTYEKLGLTKKELVKELSIRNNNFIQGDIKEEVETMFKDRYNTNTNVKKENVNNIVLVNGKNKPNLSADDDNSLEIVRICRRLPIEYIDDYNKWIRVGMVFSYEGYKAEDWYKVIPKDYILHDRSLERHIQQFKYFKTSKKPYTIDSIYYWLKKDNKEFYDELMETNTTFWDLVNNNNHNDVAKYFFNLMPNSYLWNEGLGWFSIEGNNSWKHHDSKKPSGLKYTISNVLQQKVKEFKEIELKNYSKKSLNINMEDKDIQDKLLKSHQKKLLLLNDVYNTYGNTHFTNGVIDYLPSYYEDDELDKKMDLNKQLIAFTNGVFDLEKCIFRDIQPNDFICLTTGYDFITETDMKNDVEHKKYIESRKEVMDLFKSIFTDEDTIQYVLDIFTSCLYGGNKFEKFYVMTGTGGNGKGVEFDLLINVFGDYYCSVDINLFTKAQDKKDAPNPALVLAKGCKIMVSTEPERDEKLQASFIKKISGNDIVEARTLNSKNIVKYVPTYKAFIQANNIPKMSKMDKGVQRRMEVINHPISFKSEEEIEEKKAKGINVEHMRVGDVEIKDTKCKSKEWRIAFINILIDNWIKRVKNLKTLDSPKSVKETTNDYMDDNNYLKDWLHKYFEITTDFKKDRIKSEDLIKYYKDDTGFDISSKGLKEGMTLNDIQNIKSGSMFYTGIKRKPNPCLININNIKKDDDDEGWGINDNEEYGEEVYEDEC